MDICKRNILIFFGISILLFTLMFPLSYSISFIQNDEWVHYLVLNNFLGGNFSLHPRIGSTFYTQGILAYLFSLIWSVERIPILTLFISVLNFYLTALIVLVRMKKSLLISIISGLFILLNPIHVYSQWGFMTENYFLFFFLLSLYFSFGFLSNNKFNNFFLANLFMILGFFIKQYGLVLPVSFSFALFVKKQYKHAVIQFVLSAVLFLFYKTLFPITPIMENQSLSFDHIFNLKYMVSYSAGIMVYLCAFVLPLVFSASLKGLSRSKLIISGILSLILLFLLLSFFDRLQFEKREFPYFENTFERNGFFTIDITGSKYPLPYVDNIFNLWEIISFIVLVIGLPLILMRRKVNDPVFVQLGSCILLYFSFLLLSPMLYDRYLLPLVPLFILIVVLPHQSFSKSSISVFMAFLIFLFFLNYQFSMDFLGRNNYTWQKSESLYNSGISKTDINPGHSWRMLSLDEEQVERWDYIFRYDPISKRPKDIGDWEVIETYEVKYPFNMFEDPYIYLYKRL